MKAMGNIVERRRNTSMGCESISVVVVDHIHRIESEGEAM